MPTSLATTPFLTFTLAQQPTSDQVLSGSTAAPTGTTTTTGAPGAPVGPAAPQAAPPGLNMLLLVPLFLAVLIIPQWLGSRKEKKKRATMMSSMGKGDKVITIGGQIGVIDQIRETEIVLRIDENSNAKARFSKASIQMVLESSGKSSTESEPASNGTIEVKAKNDKTVAAR